MSELVPTSPAVLHDRLADVVAVVVHHRSYDTVAETVSGLLSQGLGLANIVLVDNSEYSAQGVPLCFRLPENLTVLQTANRGYGAAVNTALDYFAEARGEPPKYFIVATHETRTRPDAVRHLFDALENDSAAALAGPTIVGTGRDGEFVWSTGGYLSDALHLPQHYDHRAPLTPELVSGAPIVRTWLDGAFIMYRWSDIAAFRVEESFFLYMEETDLHLRLREAGLHALWVPAAVVWQSSSGIPPYYLARGLRMLLRRHDSPWRRALVVPLWVIRNFLVQSIKSRSVATLIPAVKGLTAPIATPCDPLAAIIIPIINPLGAAFHHYQKQTECVLRSVGVRTISLSTREPSHSGGSRVSWLCRYFQLCQRAGQINGRNSASRALVLWPALGYWDIVLLRLMRVRASVVIHDPRPLVRAIGYGRLAGWLATIASSGLVDAIVLSAEAEAEVTVHAPKLSCRLLPHPIMPGTAVSAQVATLPVIRVLGQYKKDRDLDALREISSRLAGEASFEIYGRDWPDVSGWAVTPVFVTELEMTKLIATSSVVVIPYRRFFQSGMAFRCLEAGIPFIGPRQSNLAPVLGIDSPLLVDQSEDWERALRWALVMDGVEAKNSADQWRAICLAEWRKWAEQSASVASNAR